MKKILLSAFVIIVFIGYAIHQRTDSGNAQVTPPSSLKSSSSSSSSTSSSNSTSPSSGSSPTTTTSGGYKDGSYTGDSVDAYYGYVQVKATISRGKITDVQFLDYPQDRSTSRMINSQAMPYLQQEAIQAQNAQVDTISGASATSGAFIQSLQSALDKAKA
jgi:uncharacterized protein with FMN-binding domain